MPSGAIDQSVASTLTCLPSGSVSISGSYSTRAMMPSISPEICCGSCVRRSSPRDHVNFFPPPAGAHAASASASAGAANAPRPSRIAPTTSWRRLSGPSRDQVNPSFDGSCALLMACFLPRVILRMYSEHQAAETDATRQLVPSAQRLEIRRVDLDAHAWRIGRCDDAVVREWNAFENRIEAAQRLGVARVTHDYALGPRCVHRRGNEVQRPRLQATRMRNNVQTPRRSQCGDLAGFGDTPDPRQVRLQDVAAPAGNQLTETPARVLVLARGNGSRVDARCQLRIALVVVRRKRLFDPTHAQRLQQARHAECVLNIPGHVAIEHDLSVRSHAVTSLFDKRDIGFHAFPTISRAVRHRQLEGLEA